MAIYGQSQRPAVFPAEDIGVGGVGHLLPGNLGR